MSSFHLRLLTYPAHSELVCLFSRAHCERINVPKNQVDQLPCRKQSLVQDYLCVMLKKAKPTLGQNKAMAGLFILFLSALNEMLKFIYYDLNFFIQIVF